MYDVHDNNRLSELMQRDGLIEFRDHFAGSLSGGYKCHLVLAYALTHDVSGFVVLFVVASIIKFKRVL